MMKSFTQTTLIFLTALVAFASTNSYAQVGINTAAPNASSMLDITSTNKGVLVPRMTTAQRTAIAAPADGLLVYETTTDQFFYFDGAVWRPLASSTTAWNLTGNTGTIAGTNFIGTTDSVDWIVKTKNVERMRVKGKGNVAIGGISNPLAVLDVFASTSVDTLIYRGRNNSSSGTTTQIGSIEWFKDFSNTIDFNNNVNSAQFAINLNNNATHDLQLAFDDAAKPGTNTWTISSDARLKDDVQPFRDGLETIEKVNPVYYRYNGKAGTPAGEYYVGVLAQELQQATPYMVGSFEFTPDPKNLDNREEYLSVNNGAMTYILVNSVKELNERTQKLDHALQTITDFGVSQLSGTTETEIAFSDEFSSSLSNEKLPVVTVTPVNSTIQVSVKEVTQHSFIVVGTGNTGGVSVNWIAAAKINKNQLQLQKEYPAAERSQLLEKVKMKKAVIRTQEEASEMQKRNIGKSEVK